MAWARVTSPFDVVLAARKNGTPTATRQYPAGWEGSLPRAHLETGVAKGCAVEIEQPAGKKSTKKGETVPTEEPPET